MRLSTTEDTVESLRQQIAELSYTADTLQKELWQVKAELQELKFRYEGETINSVI